MAGAVFVGMGATLHYQNAQIFSYSQHPSNTCYSGAIVYEDTYMTGNSGRIFSTDFFGGQIVLDKAVYDKSNINLYLDETSSLYCVDSFLPGLSGANTGISQAYYQNSLIYNISSAFGFSNNTSMPDDIATGTFVNCDLHFATGKNTIATVSREQNALVTMVDTTVDMDEYADGYMFNITGDEFELEASLMVDLVNTDLPAEDVFVSGPHTYSTNTFCTVTTGEMEEITTEGTSLYIKADSNSTATLRQKQGDTQDLQFYSAKKDAKYTVNNTGTIYVYDNDTETWIATGLTKVSANNYVATNSKYATVSCENGVWTATYKIGGVTVILEAASPFTDIPDSGETRTAIDYAVANGLMNGTSDTTFSPNSAITRGQIITILYRLEGEPAVTDTASFSDVSSSKYYANAIAWAKSVGIVTGNNDGTFRPDEALTRQQFAAILYRYAQYKGYDTTVTGDLDSFKDGSTVGSYARDAMNWANGVGLIKGTTSNTLSPTGTATRGQAAIILMRLCENVAK
jgi:uncharacterized protein YaiE (UPF0345 family)